MFELARGYREHGMSTYADLQEREFASEDDGFTAVQHQQELSGSTEESQFQG
jgi:isocitrate/methylisocitrate lyase